MNFIILFFLISVCCFLKCYFICLFLLTESKTQKKKEKKENRKKKLQGEIENDSDLTPEERKQRKQEMVKRKIFEKFLLTLNTKKPNKITLFSIVFKNLLRKCRKNSLVSFIRINKKYSYFTFLFLYFTHK